MPGDELFDVAKHRFDVAGGKEMVAAGIFDQFGVGDTRCQFAAVFNRNLHIALIMEHECRNAHGREDRTDIDLRIQHRKGFDRSRTGRQPFELGELGNARPGPLPGLERHVSTLRRCPRTSHAARLVP